MTRVRSQRHRKKSPYFLSYFWATVPVHTAQPRILHTAHFEQFLMTLYATDKAQHFAASADRGSELHRVAPCHESHILRVSDAVDTVLVNGIHNYYSQSTLGRQTVAD
jgi:hypothetical protein